MGGWVNKGEGGLHTYVKDSNEAASTAGTTTRLDSGGVVQAGG